MVNETQNDLTAQGHTPPFAVTDALVLLLKPYGGTENERHQTRRDLLRRFITHRR